jgi:hypothetical protein
MPTVSSGVMKRRPELSMLSAQNGSVPMARHAAAGTESLPGGKLRSWHATHTRTDTAATAPRGSGITLRVLFVIA